VSQPSHLRSLQALELAVRTGSLKAAADELRITPAAVGQRIKLLEDYLGLDLVVRGRSGIRPSGALEATMPHLSAAFRELDTAARLLDFQRVDEIHVVADADWAELWLGPRLPRFRAAHPNVRFCINGVGDVPIRLGHADCEIWFGPARGHEAEEGLFRDYLVPVSSPENTRRISSLPLDERLEGFPLLHVDGYKGDPEAIGWPEWIGRFGHRRTAPGRGVRYRKVVQALEAVYSNVGLMVCGLALAEADVVSGRLSLPFPLAQGAWTGQSYRLRVRDGAIRRRQVGLFREWLLAEAADTTSMLERMVGG
jgi:LysR family glycine cleavage system transcriptional activator